MNNILYVSYCTNSRNDQPLNRWFCCQNHVYYFLGTLILYICFYIIKINNFQGGLTEVFAESKTLLKTDEPAGLESLLACSERFFVSYNNEALKPFTGGSNQYVYQILRTDQQWGTKNRKKYLPYLNPHIFYFCIIKINSFRGELSDILAIFVLCWSAAFRRCSACVCCGATGSGGAILGYASWVQASAESAHCSPRPPAASPWHGHCPGRLCSPVGSCTLTPRHVFQSRAWQQLACCYGTHRSVLLFSKLNLIFFGYDAEKKI